MSWPVIDWHVGVYGLLIILIVMVLIIVWRELR